MEKKFTIFSWVVLAVAVTAAVLLSFIKEGII